MEKIEVPFSQKAKARSLGVYFEKGDRCWYIPDNLSEENKNLLRNLKNIEVESLPTVSLEKENKTAENAGQIIELPQSRYSLQNETWEKLIAEKDVLKITMAIRDVGMPGNEQMRIEVLKVLTLRRPEDYPINYNDLAKCSENFAFLYSIDRVRELITKCIKDGRPYTEQVKNSHVTEEEKALLLFVLPLF